MTHRVATTPFGRRTVSLGLIATQAQAREVAPEKTVHKWKVFQAITEAKDKLGLPDRAVAVLYALLSFHPETTLSAGDPLIVFPSNAKLCARAHGIAPATLRRHLGVLVEAGIVIRRDSPNGKRYARRGAEGEVSQAFGFELTPLVARAEEFEALAEAVRAEQRALRLARERITLARRDITRLILLGRETQIAGDWEGLQAQFLVLSAPLRRSAGLSIAEQGAAALEEMAIGILNHLELFIQMPETSGNESQDERHKQNSKPDLYESEPAFRKDRGENLPGARHTGEEEAGERKASAREEDDASLPSGKAREGKIHESKSLGTPLPLVLEACPDLLDYMGDRNAGDSAAAPVSWSDVLRAAELVRAMLGISPDAWRDAVETMGPVDAAIMVAAILQKGDEVRFPGGYLRALTEKKRAGEFSVGPVLMALLGGRLKGLRAAARRGTLPPEA
jgi:replication initiation protein RepC